MKIFLKPKNDSPWHEWFKYEPSTGNLVNRFDRGNASRAGMVAGAANSQGYVTVGVSGVWHGAHRVIWEMVNGPIPEGMEIDHINGVRSDNRLGNLRLVTRAENTRNRKRQVNNTSGYMGVYWNKEHGKYRAQIGVAGTRRYLGSFATAEEAHQVYLAAAKELGFHSNHGRIH